MSSCRRLAGVFLASKAPLREAFYTDVPASDSCSTRGRALGGWRRGRGIALVVDLTNTSVLRSNDFERFGVAHRRFGRGEEEHPRQRVSGCVWVVGRALAGRRTIRRGRVERDESTGDISALYAWV